MLARILVSAPARSPHIPVCHPTNLIARSSSPKICCSTATSFVCSLTFGLVKSCSRCPLTFLRNFCPHFEGDGKYAVSLTFGLKFANGELVFTLSLHPLLNATLAKLEKRFLKKMLEINQLFDKYFTWNENKMLTNILLYV